MSISIQNLLQSIKKAADLIAKEPPQIVLDIFQRGIFKNNAGTRGGKLATLVFIQGVCRSLAYDCVNNFVYMNVATLFTCQCKFFRVLWI
jgi:hypothetical protein